MTEQERTKRLQQEQPVPPQGFDARHDALLEQITGKGEKVMKRKLSFGMVFVLAVLLLALSVAVAAGLGVFGEFAGDNQDARLESLEKSAQTYDEKTAVDELSAQYPEIDFAMTQAHYDGESLYIAYSLSGTLSTLEYMDADQAADIEWDFTPADGEMFTEWEKKLTPEAYAQMQEKLNTEGRILVAVYDQYLGDGIFMDDDTYINPSRSDVKMTEDGTQIGYTEYEFPLPDEARNKDSLQLNFRLFSSASLYYQDENGTYYKFDYAERAEPLRLPVTVQRNGMKEALHTESVFDEYHVAISTTITDVDVKVECTVDGPDAWLKAWEDWDSEADFLFGYNLYADGKLCTMTGHSSYDEDGMLKFLLDYEKPEAYTTLSLRPEYSQSGERIEEEIILTGEGMENK